MIDIGLFLSAGFDEPQNLLAARLRALIDLGWQGGIVHLTEAQGQITDKVDAFQFAIDARSLGRADVDLNAISFVTYRSSILHKPGQLSALLAKCADIGATLLLQSPMAEAATASPLLAARGGHREAPFHLAESLLEFVAKEARYYGCRTHVYGISTPQELAILQPYRAAEALSTSVPMYVLDAGLDPMGYELEGRPVPGLVDAGIRAVMLDLAASGAIDALTSHHHAWTDNAELDPLSAPAGVNIAPMYAGIAKRVADAVGPDRFKQLTVSQPAAIAANV